MTSASSGLVRIEVRQSGMTELTKRVRLSRTWGTAIVIGPSAVAICLERWPLREPRAAGVRSKRARPKEPFDLLLDRPLEHELGAQAAELAEAFEVVDLAFAFESVEQQMLDLRFDLDARGYPCLHGVVLLMRTS